MKRARPAVVRKGSSLSNQTAKWLRLLKSSEWSSARAPARSAFYDDVSDEEDGEQDAQALPPPANTEPAAGAEDVEEGGERVAEEVAHIEDADGEGAGPGARGPGGGLAEDDPFALGALESPQQEAVEEEEEEEEEAVEADEGEAEEGANSPRQGGLAAGSAPSLQGNESQQGGGVKAVAPLGQFAGVGKPGGAREQVPKRTAKPRRLKAHSAQQKQGAALGKRLGTLLSRQALQKRTAQSLLSRKIRGGIVPRGASGSALTLRVLASNGVEGGCLVCDAVVLSSSVAGVAADQEVRLVLQRDEASRSLAPESRAILEGTAADCATALRHHRVLVHPPCDVLPALGGPPSVLAKHVSLEAVDPPFDEVAAACAAEPVGSSPESAGRPSESDMLRALRQADNGVVDIASVGKGSANVAIKGEILRVYRRAVQCAEDQQAPPAPSLVIAKATWNGTAPSARRHVTLVEVVIPHRHVDRWVPILLNGEGRAVVIHGLYPVQQRPLQTAHFATLPFSGPVESPATVGGVHTTLQASRFSSYEICTHVPDPEEDFVRGLFCRASLPLESLAALGGASRVTFIGVVCGVHHVLHGDDVKAVAVVQEVTTSASGMGVGRLVHVVASSHWQLALCEHHAVAGAVLVFRDAVVVRSPALEVASGEDGTAFAMTKSWCAELDHWSELQHLCEQPAAPHAPRSVQAMFHGPHGLGLPKHNLSSAEWSGLQAVVNDVQTEFPQRLGAGVSLPCPCEVPFVVQGKVKGVVVLDKEEEVVVLSVKIADSDVVARVKVQGVSVAVGDNVECECVALLDAQGQFEMLAACDE